ncbi:TSUP family transporter [Bordetella sp. 02P26C-1]|uniref:TSUP family transporter n=1 Tax=Bordetella sp. 02P26C-1 TaxID=2683195 RepID=UPI0013535533|nr:TSUP family transporter [Bordetella sp. 02P26C-1]MVW79796.1 TSUP family transporter [Bordetella sp. 02P26C-1]
MSGIDHLLYLAFVALASYAQTMTGFAFALILLGLTGLFSLATLPEMVNAVNMLTLVNAVVALRGAGHELDWRMMRAPMIASLIGVVGGVMALEWIAGNAALLARALLGLTILVCALLLVIRTRPRERLSSRSSFISFGLVSGLLGGLFSAAGPPMVYHLYRQPLPLALIRNSLLILFAANATLRLGLVAASGNLSLSSVWLAAEALPVVVMMSAWARHRARASSVQTVKRLVFVLLLASGLGLLIPALSSLLS